MSFSSAGAANVTLPRRVFDWPLVIQTLLFIGTLLGVAVYSEHRITMVEQMLIHHSAEIARIVAVQEQMAGLQQQMLINQTRVLTILENRKK